jgi:hypothetical protein
MTKDNEWSEDIHWVDIVRAHLITGTHTIPPKAGAFMLKAGVEPTGGSKTALAVANLIAKQIEAGNVRQVSPDFYQFKLTLLEPTRKQERKK